MATDFAALLAKARPPHDWASDPYVIRYFDLKEVARR